MELFIGREEEINILTGLFEEVKNGLGKVVFISAESGSGKTTLVRQFISGLDPVAVISSAECNQPNRSSPYLPFQEILAKLTSDDYGYSLAERITLRDVIYTVLKESGSGWLSVIPIFGSALAAGITTAQSFKKAISAKKSTQYIRGINDIVFYFDRELRKLAIQKKQPLIIFIDDLHWIDPSSCDLIFGIARKLREKPYPLLLIGTYRPVDIYREDGHPMVNVLNNLRSYTREEMHITRVDQWLVELNLRLFEKKEIEELIAQQFKNNNFPEDFKLHLVEITGGNPMFLIGILAFLLEKGQISENDGKWNLGTNAIHQLPASIEALIAARFDKIGSDLRRILECASIQGNDFTVQIIQRVLLLNEISLWNNLNDLNTKHALIVSGGTSLLQKEILDLYHFSHVLYQKHLYDHLQPGQRRAYHRQVALVMKELYGEKVELDNNLKHQLNQHIQIASGLIDAISLQLTSQLEPEINSALVMDQATAELQLANSYFQQYSMQLCIEKCDNAINFTGLIQKQNKAALKLKFDAFELAIKACFWLANFNAVGNYLKEEALLAKESADEEMNIAVTINIGKLSHEKGEYDIALTNFAKALHLAEKISNEALIAKCHSHLGNVYQRKALYKESYKSYEKVLDYYLSVSDDFNISESHLSIASAYQGMGEYENAKSHFDLAIQFALNLDNKELLGKIYNNLGFYYSKKGNWVNALKYYKDSLAIALEMDDRKKMSIRYNNVGFMLKNLKRYDESMENHLSSLRISEDNFDNLAIALSHSSISTLYRAKGDMLKAFEHLSISIQHAESKENQLKLAIRYNNMGLLLTDMLRFEEASEYFLKSMDINVRAENEMRVVSNHMGLGNLENMKGNPEAALIQFNLALNILQGKKDKDKNLADCLYSIAKTYAALSNDQEYKNYLQRSLDEFTENGNEEKIQEITEKLIE